MDKVFVFLFLLEGSYWIVWLLSKKFKFFFKVLSFFDKYLTKGKNKSCLNSNNYASKDNSSDLLSFNNDIYYNPAYKDNPVNVHYKFPE